MKNLIKALKALQKGSFLSVTISKTVKPLKTHSGAIVRKQTKVVVCSGIEYDNQKTVKADRDNGSKPEENAGLPWGNWKQYPYEIEHKGASYVRLYIKGAPQVVWTENGKVIDKERAIELCGSKAKSSEGKPDCITAKLENVIEAIQNGKQIG